MTQYTSADIDMADRHIAEGERHVARQQEIIADLRSANQPAGIAEDLLRQFQDSLAAHHKHRDLIVAALRKRDRDPEIG